MSAESKSEDLQKFVLLNKEFLSLIESGKTWEELTVIREQLREIARNLDHVPATLLNFDNYPLHKTGEQKK